MAVIKVALEVIDDNPYNPRKHYPQAKVNEMAQSLREVGLRQVPEGRHVDGRVQLAYGHMRLRGFRYNQKMPREPEKWTNMPVDVKEISDQDMFHYAMEENLRRTDITPIEVARCIQAFGEMFPDVTEKELGEKHSMSEANVSNMKRTLRLPEKMLEKIDEGIISFHQGRDLLIFERFENAENLMRSALDGLKTGNKAYGEPNTVDGLQKSIHSIIKGQCRPLDKEWEGYPRDLLFDTRAAGCLECEKMLRTHPTKSATAHWCTDEECWDRHQKEHRDTAAAAAKAKMEAEVINRAAQVIAEEEKAPAPAPVMIDENTVLVDQETFEKIGASYSADRISEGTAVRRPVEFEGNLYVVTGSGMGKVEAYQLVPSEEFTGEVRTYKVPAGRESDEYYESLRNDPAGFYHGMLVKRGKVDYVLVGPEVTFVTTVDQGNFSREKLPGQVEAADETDRFLETVAAETEAQARERDRQMEETRERANLERPVGELPCDTCAKGQTCERTFFHVADDDSGRLVCEQWECAMAPAPTPQEIPEDILALAREKAGTRAEVLDLKDIGAGYYQEVAQGYALLDGFGRPLECIVDPDECLERCTHGFHYAFDSRQPESRTRYVCSDTKCLAQKKAAFTRAKNAEGQARKKAEIKAIKEAITQTTTLDRPRIKLILLTQMDGEHTQRYYSDGKNPEKWLWDKVSAGTPENDRTRQKLFKAIDKLTDDELARLVVEFMFYYLTDKGDIGSYEIKAEEPLKWMGIDIKMEAA